MGDRWHSNDLVECYAEVFSRWTDEMLQRELMRAKSMLNGPIKWDQWTVDRCITRREAIRLELKKRGIKESLEEYT